MINKVAESLAERVASQVFVVIAFVLSVCNIVAAAFTLLFVNSFKTTTQNIHRHSEGKMAEQYAKIQKMFPIYNSGLMVDILISSMCIGLVIYNYYKGNKKTVVLIAMFVIAHVLFATWLKKSID